MSTRSERAERRRAVKCPRCGQDGPHFVPPSFGDTGFYICGPLDGPKPSRRDFPRPW